MSLKTSRGQWIKLRVSPAEKALIEERAATAGLTTSEYIRREAGIGKFGRADLRRAGEIGHTAPEHQTSSSFEARVRREMRTMPRVNAEKVVRREEAREKAKAALAAG
jgi:hypothetical protein